MREEDGAKLGAQVVVADLACQQRHGRDPRLGGGSGKNTIECHKLKREGQLAPSLYLKSSQSS